MLGQEAQKRGHGKNNQMQQNLCNRLCWCIIFSSLQTHQGKVHQYMEYRAPVKLHYHIHDGIKQLNNRNQLCYFFNVEDIYFVFCIVAKKFQVDKPTWTVFKAKCLQDEVVSAPNSQTFDLEAEEVCCLQQNMAQNIKIWVSANLLCVDILKLHHQWIKADDDNESALENTCALPAQASIGTWIFPAIYAQHANPKISDSWGNILKSLWMRLEAWENSNSSG